MINVIGFLPKLCDLFLWMFPEVDSTIIIFPVYVDVTKALTSNTVCFVDVLLEIFSFIYIHVIVSINE